MPKDGVPVERISLTLRTTEGTRGSLAKIADAIDRDVTYVHRGIVAFGIEKFLSKPKDLTAFMLRQKRRATSKKKS
jgi:hypothetical protein